MRRRLASALAAAGILLGLPVRGPSAPEPVSAAFARILEEQRLKLHMPAIAFVAVRGDETIALGALGQRDIDRKLPATADTIFPIGSCTKAFTALAVAASQDDGRLTLDDRPHRYLPYFKMADPEADALVTLRDMLSHRTGLKGYADLAAEPGVLTRAEYIRVATGAKPAARFRSQFQYSNAMFVAAGEAAAAASQTTWEDLLTRRLLGPLGMTRTYADARRSAADPDHATGYEWDAAKARWSSASFPASLDALAPAGSAGSTARDLGRWLRFLIGRGALDGRRVVSESAWREVTTPHTRINSDWSYGLGWVLYTWNGHAVVEHNGGSRGISALVSFMPEEGVGFALVANVTPTTLTRIGEAGKLLWPVLTGEAAPAATPRPSPPPPSPPEATLSGSPLPSVPELLARMVAAAGGERNIRGHTSLEARYDKRYLNHGVDAALTVRSKVPDRLAEDETLLALGRTIGEVRVRFDGRVGGQETTFGQDETYSGPELEHLRRRAPMNRILDLGRGYDRLTVARGTPIDGDEVAVLAGHTADQADLFHVSTRTWLLLRAEHGAETTTFADYRNVGGVVVPHRIHVEDALGESELTLRSLRFDVPVADEAFRLKAPAAARSAAP